MPKTAFYAVGRGRTVGIFPTWNECKQQIDGFKGAKYKKFPTVVEAEQFINEWKVVPKGTDQNSGNLAGLLGTINHTGLGKRSYSTISSGTGQDTPAAKIPLRLNGLSINWDEVSVVYTDGACSNNGKKKAMAGYGVHWPESPSDDCFGPVYGDATNNRGELLAVSVALQQAITKGMRAVVIKTDSQFLINAMDSWIIKWKKNGFKTSDGAPVKNQDLLIDLDTKLTLIHAKLDYVPGHKGVAGNERADELARKGACMYQK